MPHIEQLVVQNYREHLSVSVLFSLKSELTPKPSPKASKAFPGQSNQRQARKSAS